MAVTSRKRLSDLGKPCVSGAFFIVVGFDQSVEGDRPPLLLWPPRKDLHGQRNGSGLGYFARQCAEAFQRYLFGAVCGFEACGDQTVFDIGGGAFEGGAQHLAALVEGGGNGAGEYRCVCGKTGFRQGGARRP